MGVESTDLLFGVHLGTAFWSRFGPWREILKKLLHFPAHNFVAHLSGWVGDRYGATAGVFFVPSWANGVSGWGVQKSRKNKFLIMKFSIMEIVATACESMFKLSQASQTPYNAQIQLIKF